MTVGIYKLTFSSGAEYIGKSIDIESRFEEHKRSFKQFKAAKKLQQEFLRSREPTCSILVECHPDHIDFLETFFISKEKPALNTVIGNAMSDTDFELVRKYGHLLNKSTIEHLAIIDELAATSDQTDMVDLLNEEISALEDKIGKMHKQPWYKRLFSW